MARLGGPLTAPPSSDEARALAERLRNPGGTASSGLAEGAPGGGYGGPGATTPPTREPDPPKPTWRGRLRGVRPRVWVAVGLVILLAAAALVYALTRPPSPPPLTKADVDAAVQDGIKAQQQKDAQAPSDATVAYQAIQPSLVLISTTEPATATSKAAKGTGAGVIVRADGTIMTALHVVDGATSITVQYTDGTSSPAKVASRQAANDIATLTPQTPPQTIVPAVLGGGVTEGMEVFPVGHPLGLADTLTAGVVSATNRTVPIPGGGTLSHLIQFDAAVNPGNSGGPLLNKAGQVVGIVTGLANPSNQNFFVGIGFAVPIATAGGGAGGPSQ